MMMNVNYAYLLMAISLGFFAWLGITNALKKESSFDEYLSARNSQSWVSIGLSLFASGMGIWILFGPSEVGYYGGFYDVVGYALSSATPFILLANIGPIIRKITPEGVTLADYVKQRMGRTMQIYVGIISILYMLTFMFAEYIAIGKAMNFLSGMDPLIPIIAVGIVTTVYTAMGGLPVSIKTDRIQSYFVIWLIICILLIIATSGMSDMWENAKAYTPEDVEWGWTHGSISDYSTFEAGLALVLAITAAEMFSQGNWQRAWASENDLALRKGSYLAAGLCFIAVLLMGFLGTVKAGEGALNDPSIAFFELIKNYSTWVLAMFVIMGIALVCSSIDTLQNALVAVISRDITDNKISLKEARYVTVAIVPIAVILAWYLKDETLSVFRIFLVADLFAAATVLPIFLTLSDKITSKGSLMGAISGLLSVVVYGAITADLGTGIGYLTNPVNEWGLANLGVFLSALIGSGSVTIISSVIFNREET